MDGLMKKYSQNSSFLIALTLAATLNSGCGKPPQPPSPEPIPPPIANPTPPESDAPQAAPDPATANDGMVTLKGSAMIASQCPYGSLADPQPVEISMWDCPIGTDTAELQESLRTIIIMGDCNKKYVSVRSGDRRSLDTLWETMPNGDFSVTVDGGLVQFSKFGATQSSCATPTSVDIWGKLDCAAHADPTRDQGTVQIEAMWHLGKGATTGVNADAVCKLPAPPAGTDGCYIYAKTAIKQCQ